MTFDEFKYLNEGQSNESSSSETYDEVFKIAEFELEVNCNLSSSLDWRLFGAVSRVKNQKLCGSCFIFAVIASIECHLFLNTEKLLDLSVQEVVDCGGKFQGGCDGGTASLVFDYVNTKGGLALYSDYPYEAVRNTCRSENYQRQNISKVTFLKNPNYDEVLLQNALHMYGPIVIFLDIAHESFMRYSRGIYFNTDCTHITNHVALLVGYDSDNGLDYWIVKNSFGESWGEGGYIRIARNQNNQCGIGTVYYAIEKDGNWKGTVILKLMPCK